MEQMPFVTDTPRPCPVCGLPYLVFVTRKKTIRTHRELPLYGCLACQSFSNPSGYVEDSVQLARDLDWHKTVADRNAMASRELLGALRIKGVDISRILEIGAGIGTLLKVARDEFGSTGIGYEVNPLTQTFARETHDVDVRAEIWTSGTECGPYSLMLCIMVLEHIPEPRSLLQDMVRGCLWQNAALFVSVPFFDRDRWHFLHECDPRTPQNQFFDNDVHVTHFSPTGMESALREFGMTSIEWVRQGLWHGLLARATDDACRKI